MRILWGPSWTSRSPAETSEGAMKIFMATMGLGIGGAETHIVELAKELKARGHDSIH